MQFEDNAPKQRLDIAIEAKNKKILRNQRNKLNGKNKLLFLKFLFVTKRKYLMIIADEEMVQSIDDVSKHLGGDVNKTKSELLQQGEKIQEVADQSVAINLLQKMIGQSKGL